ncbi:MAG: hypothetical protein FWD97_06560 [Defluviitaleaceae bacterium]|nr:hypothetical protein [Defluviitaleaceae bacterium]
MKKRILIGMAVACTLLFSGCGGDDNGSYENPPIASHELAFYELRDNQTGNSAGMGDTLADFIAAFGAYDTSEYHGMLTTTTFLNGSLVVTFGDNIANMIILHPNPAEIAGGRFTVYDITTGMSVEDLLAIDDISGPHQSWDVELFGDEFFGRVKNVELSAYHGFSYVKSIFIENGAVSHIVISMAG